MNRIEFGERISRTFRKTRAGRYRLPFLFSRQSPTRRHDDYRRITRKILESTTRKLEREADGRREKVLESDEE